MAVAVGIDTSVLIAAEKRGGIEQLLLLEEGPFCLSQPCGWN